MKIFLFIVSLCLSVFSFSQTARLIDSNGLKLEVKLDDDLVFRDIADGTTNIIVEYHYKKPKKIVYDVVRFKADASRQYAYISRSITTSDLDDSLQRIYNFVKDDSGNIILVAVVRKNGVIENIKFGLRL